MPNEDVKKLRSQRVNLKVDNNNDLFLPVYVCPCVWPCVFVCVFAYARKGRWDRWLVVSVMFPNYLIVPCGHVDQDGIGINCLRLLWYGQPERMDEQRWWAGGRHHLCMAARGNSACKPRQEVKGGVRVLEFTYWLLSVLFQDHDNSSVLLGKSL